MSGEQNYRDNEGAAVYVKCTGRYTGPGKVQYFCYQPYQAKTLEELRAGICHAGVMIPNGNVWQYPLSTVEFE